jgi:serine palmitoyltransferase
LLKGSQEIDELVADWTPEPLVTAPTQFEELENEKRPVIVGCVTQRPRLLEVVVG